MWEVTSYPFFWLPKTYLEMFGVDPAGVTTKLQMVDGTSVDTLLGTPP